MYKDRVILHCDLNSFFASCSLRSHPHLKEHPVAVGGDAESRHGIILAKNERARKYGVKTAEAIWQALQKCPGLIILPSDYPLYLQTSQAVRRIFADYTDMIEPFGIDEAWLDVTASTRLFGDGQTLADTIRTRISSELGITASIGVSFNKVFAKLGSDLHKPDKTTTVFRHEFKDKIWPLPVEALLFVGRSTSQKLRSRCIYTIGDLARYPVSSLKYLLGKWGDQLWLYANGLDEAPVLPASFESSIKGIGNSTTTPRDLVTDRDVQLTLWALADSIAGRLRSHCLKGQTVQVSIRDTSLTSIVRQSKLPGHSYVCADIAGLAMSVFRTCWNWEKPVRSLGIRVTDLISADSCIQFSLLGDDERRQRREQLEFSIDDIRKRYGQGSIQRGPLLEDKHLAVTPADIQLIFPVGNPRQGY